MPSGIFIGGVLITTYIVFNDLNTVGISIRSTHEMMSALAKNLTITDINTVDSGEFLVNIHEIM